VIVLSKVIVLRKVIVYAGDVVNIIGLVAIHKNGPLLPLWVGREERGERREERREKREERGERKEERREKREERGEGSGLRHTAHNMNQDFLTRANMKGIVKQRMCPVGVESLDR